MGCALSQHDKSQFFICWTNLIPTTQSCELLSDIQEINMSLISQFARSTEPWLWGWRGRQCTMVIGGHMTFSSLMTLREVITALSNSFRLLSKPVQASSVIWTSKFQSLREMPRDFSHFMEWLSELVISRNDWNFQALRVMPGFTICL